MKARAALVLSLAACGSSRPTPSTAPPPPSDAAAESTGASAPAGASSREGTTGPSIATREAIATEDTSRCHALSRGVGDAHAAVFVTSSLVCFGREEATSDQALTRLASKARRLTQARTVTVYADADVPYARVVAVMDALRAGGLDDVTLGVNR